MARNTGIDTATGDFICFFDSDDFIDPHTIQEAIEVVEKPELRLCHSDIMTIQTAR